MWTWLLHKNSKIVKNPNSDKLQSERNYIFFFNVTNFLGSNYEKSALSNAFRTKRNLEIETSIFCSNQMMKIQEIDHSDIWGFWDLTLKGPGGGALLCPPLSKSNALDLWLGPHLQNLYDYSNWTLWHRLVQSDLSFHTWNFEKLEFID